MGIKWKEDYSARTQRCWGVMLGVAVGVLAGTPAGGGATKFPSDTSFILALVTAIGTIGSAIGAVGIAGWQYLIARREKMAEALSAAASSYLTFRLLAGELNNLYKRFEAAICGDAPEIEFKEVALRAEALQTKYAFPDPIKFRPISAILSANIAASLGQLKVVATTFGQIADTVESGGWRDDQEKMNDKRFVEGIALAATGLLNKSGMECQNAVFDVHANSKRG